MAKRVRKTSFCASCSALMPIEALGLCNKCYRAQPSRRATEKIRRAAAPAVVRPIAECTICAELTAIIGLGLCSACYYKQPITLAKRRAYVKKRRKAIRDFIHAAKAKPCMDCGVTYPPYVMDFDHRGDKKFNVAQMMDSNINLISIEIAKCDVVCSNCHRERTYSRLQVKVN